MTHKEKTKLNTKLFEVCNTNNIKEAIEARADVDIQNNDGWTALMQACYNNNLAITKLLIEAGADTEVQSKDGRTVISCCATEEMKELINQAIQQRKEN